jgi:phosphoserine phosphatase
MGLVMTMSKSCCRWRQNRCTRAVSISLCEGKAQAMRDFLSRQGVSADSCHAYGDDISDLPMLQAVAFPTVVRGGRELEARAMELGWRVLSPNA